MMLLEVSHVHKCVILVCCLLVARQHYAFIISAIDSSLQQPEMYLCMKSDQFLIV